MKNRNLLFFAFLLCASFIANAQDDMKAWEAYMTPGEIHKMLGTADGDWTFESSMWMAPGAQPEKGSGTASNKMVMGGRYQQSNYTGTIMGMPFEGQNLMAYDNKKKVFISSWIDNMGTGMMNLEGTLDAATKTVTLLGKMVDPMSGKEIKVREKLIWVDANTQKLEMYDTKDGKEMKSMEITLKRKM